jgi:hypothetical protein
MPGGVEILNLEGPGDRGGVVPADKARRLHSRLAEMAEISATLKSMRELEARKKLIGEEIEILMEEIGVEKTIRRADLGSFTRVSQTRTIMAGADQCRATLASMNLAPPKIAKFMELASRESSSNYILFKPGKGNTDSDSE